MNKKFTLIESIIIIVIFIFIIIIWYFGYLFLSLNTRNATRSEDVKTLTNLIESSLSTSGIIPEPSNWVDIKYWSWTIWTQGTIWKSVLSNLSEDFKKKPVDPLTQKEYTYSLLNNKKEYQIKIIYEGLIESYLVRNANASNENYYYEIKWNYNWYLASYLDRNILHILSVPSIIAENTSDTNLVNIIKNKKYVYDYHKKDPLFVPKKLELYSWFSYKIKEIPSKITFLNNYKEAYKDYKNKDETLNILDTIKINSGTYDSDMDDIANNLLLTTIKEIPSKEFFEKNQKKFLIDNFYINKNYEEVSEEERDFSDRWWINSWGSFYVKDGVWKSIQWKVKEWTKWQIKYKEHNWWLDTDWWFYPQNLFRLISNKKFWNFNQYAYFKINRYMLSNSKNRYESNWFLLFNRYKDSDNLYYAWIRVDGAAVIKKKLKWEYYTLASHKVYNWSYDRNENPNLIPINKWIWVKTEIKDLGSDKVSIELYVDTKNNWKWTLALRVIDDGKSTWWNIIKGEWYTWVRTDFMDFEIDKYYVKEI